MRLLRPSHHYSLVPNERYEAANSSISASASEIPATQCEITRSKLEHVLHTASQKILNPKIIPHYPTWHGCLTHQRYVRKMQLRRRDRGPCFIFIPAVGTADITEAATRAGVTSRALPERSLSPERSPAPAVASDRRRE